MSDDPPKKVTQNHFGSGHNINAENVNIGYKRFELSDGLLEFVLTHIPEGTPTRIEVWHGARSEQIAWRIKEYLDARNRPVIGLSVVGMSFNLRAPEKPLEIATTPEGVLIRVDATVPV